jgi:hypothetical protein
MVVRQPTKDMITEWKHNRSIAIIPIEEFRLQF